MDVLKDDKMIQKLMIDEKKCYFFGRNKQLCDFCIDHASSSRVHAALIWHKHLNRPFIIDLGSTHGTYIGNLRLDSKKPQQVPIDSSIHFGASTRTYIIRERPQSKLPLPSNELSEDVDGNLLGLPDTEVELDNLTEYNTAQNRRIALIGSDMPDVNLNPKKRRKSLQVLFNDEEEIINPEDIDPSVGRFRNLVQTTVIPKKKQRIDVSGVNHSTLTETITKRLHSFPYPTHSLYDAEHGIDITTGQAVPSALSIAVKLGLRVPNLAPEVETEPHVQVVPIQPTPLVNPAPRVEVEGPSEPKKKKYAKEAWPGKKTVHSLLV